MLKLNQIDAEGISIVDAKIKYFWNPLYFNTSFSPLPPSKKSFFNFLVVTILVQIFVLIGDVWAAEKRRLEVVDAEEHSWVRLLQLREVWELGRKMAITV